MQNSQKTCTDDRDGSFAVLRSKRKTCSKEQDHVFLFFTNLVCRTSCNPALTAIMWFRKSQLQTPITINNLQQGYDFDNSKNVCSIKIDGWRFVQAYKSININWGKWLLRQAQNVLKLQEVSFRTILINNWTQRAVEQHFGDLWPVTPVTWNTIILTTVAWTDEMISCMIIRVLSFVKSDLRNYFKDWGKKWKHPKSTDSQHELSPKKRRTSKLK